MNAADRVTAHVRAYIDRLPARDQAAAKGRIGVAAGRTAGLVRGWLNGNSRSAPRLEYLDAIADAMGATAAQLVATSTHDDVTPPVTTSATMSTPPFSRSAQVSDRHARLISLLEGLTDTELASVEDAIRTAIARALEKPVKS